MCTLQIACGPTSTAAVSDKGELYVWGNNTGGMLGVSTESTTVQHPTLVPIGGCVASVALGAMHGLAVVASKG